MVQRMRASEAQLSASKEERLRGGVEELIATATRQYGGPEFAIPLVEAVLGQLREHHEVAPLPLAERAIWESVGANFEDSGAGLLTAARSALAFADLCRASLTVEGAAQILGVDRSRISQRIADRSIYCFVDPGGQRLFPVWQFHESRIPQGLQSVFRALDGSLHPLVVNHWFQTPSVDLLVDGSEVSPLMWLTTGGDPGAAIDLLPTP